MKTGTKIGKVAILISDKIDMKTKMLLDIA